MKILQLVSSVSLIAPKQALVQKIHFRRNPAGNPTGVRHAD